MRQIIFNPDEIIRMERQGMAPRIFDSSWNIVRVVSLFSLITFVCFSANLAAQEKSNLYSFATLSEALPTSMDASGGSSDGFGVVMKSLNLELGQLTEFGTGLSFVQVYFGEGFKNGRQVYWIASRTDGEVQFLKTANQIQGDETVAIFEEEIKFDAKEEIIFPIEIRLNKILGEVEYRWALAEQSVDNGGEAVGTVKRPILSPGNPMPDFAVRSLEDGQEINLADYLGKTLVINWWASFCGPCLKEMPNLNTLAEEFKDDPNVVFLAIAWDKKDAVLRLLDKREFNYTQSLFGTGTFALFGNAFPIHLVVDASGEIAFFRAGYDPLIDKQIEQAIRGALKS